MAQQKNCADEPQIREARSTHDVSRSMNTRRLLARVALLLPCLLGALSCVAFHEARYPLTPEAQRVRIASSGQELSVALSERCHRVGRIESVLSEHLAKLRAAENAANVAQVLTVAMSNGSAYRLDVRFWSCPSRMPLRQTSR